MPLNTLSSGLLRAYEESFGLVILDSKMNVTVKKEKGNLISKTTKICPKS
jgi:hypothetical protein